MRSRSVYESWLPAGFCNKQVDKCFLIRRFPLIIGQQVEKQHLISPVSTT